MDISFENTQDDSPIKLYTTQTITSSFNPDNQFIKENVIESSFGSIFKGDSRQGNSLFVNILYLIPLDEVLMTVTNSLNTNPLSSLEETMFKKSSSMTLGSLGGNGIGMQSGMNSNSGMNGSLSAKKENDDKKKWRKRI